MWPTWRTVHQGDGLVVLFGIFALTIAEGLGALLDKASNRRMRLLRYFIFLVFFETGVGIRFLLNLIRPTSPHIEFYAPSFFLGLSMVYFVPSVMYFFFTRVRSE